MEQEFAASINLRQGDKINLESGEKKTRQTYGSLMMFTTNSLVALMFSRVSFGRRGDSVNVTLINGGLCAT